MNKRNQYPAPRNAWVACRGTYGPVTQLEAMGIPWREVRAAWAKRHHQTKRRQVARDIQTVSVAELRDWQRTTAKPMKANS